jgi:hypothetical protein
MGCSLSGIGLGCRGGVFCALAYADEFRAIAAPNIVV